METVKPKRVPTPFIAKATIPFYKCTSLLERMGLIKVKNQRKYNKNVREWATEFHDECDKVILDGPFKIAEAVIKEDHLFEYAYHKLMDEYGIEQFDIVAFKPEGMSHAFFNDVLSNLYLAKEVTEELGYVKVDSPEEFRENCKKWVIEYHDLSNGVFDRDDEKLSGFFTEKVMDTYHV